MEATILDLSSIEELMTEYEGRECHQYIRVGLLSPTVHWFYKRDTAMLYEPMDNGRYNMHIYNRAKGDKALRNWCISTGSYIFEETDAMNLMNFVKEDRRDLRFFMAAIGSTLIGKIGNELIYNISREDRERIELRRIK